MPRPRNNQNSADFCRDMGWGVGQMLVGDEGYGPSTIQITAIGEQRLLAKTLKPEPRPENNWTLGCRDWQPVEPEDVETTHTVQDAGDTKDEAAAKKLTRDEVRAAYKLADIDQMPLSYERMTLLRNLINEAMISSGLVQDTFRMIFPNVQRFDIPDVVELRCKTKNFEDREAVTFYSDGFVGLAGWADDDTYVQPILRGFMYWVEHEAEVAELN